MNSNQGSLFFAVGIVFIAVGATGRPAFVGLGAAFIVIGAGLMARRRNRLR
jgi:hypothetical protein